METKEYYGGTYPEPAEQKTKDVKANVVIVCTVIGEVPEKWELWQIEDDIKANPEFYTTIKQSIENVEVI